MLAADTDDDAIQSVYRGNVNFDIPIEDVMRGLATLPPRQRNERLMFYVSHLLNSMDEKTLAGFRAQCVAGLPATWQKEELLDLIEGNVALRGILER